MITNIAVPPLASPEAIALRLRDIEVPAELQDDALLMIERCWIADTLPDHELLDALAHGYGVVSQIVESAHGQVGREMGLIETDPEHSLTKHLAGRLPCMVTTADLRSAYLNLRSGDLLEMTSTPVSPIEDEDADEMQERYSGLDLPNSSLNLFDAAEHWMQFAMRTLSIDGYHSTVVILRGPGGGKIEMMPGGDRQTHFLFMQHIADQVRRFGYTEILVIDEAWMAPRTAPPGVLQRARDSPERQEALVIFVATADRRSRQVSAIFLRDADGAIVFEPVEVREDGQPWALEPVLNAWGYSAADLASIEE